ncbi:hypothetical protein EFA69_06645 [Rufibacter immobilis]|uniref:Uncharacterized protein n=1 Tax=Rufibacter immobilis TaxID=1348778 RepID=A0A3M9N0P8_9BACT|nr:hypothetical protein EFA69_06645 [Rufibacter immobilis]
MVSLRSSFKSIFSGGEPTSGERRELLDNYDKKWNWQGLAFSLAQEITKVHTVYNLKTSEVLSWQEHQIDFNKMNESLQKLDAHKPQ